MQRSRNVQRISIISCNEAKTCNGFSFFRATKCNGATNLYSLEQRSKNEQRNATNRLQRNATEQKCKKTSKQQQREKLVACPTLVAIFPTELQYFLLQYFQTPCIRLWSCREKVKKMDPDFSKRINLTPKSFTSS